ncbi:MAG: class I SAM-dependent methyltransferase, partial [Nitrospirota bacterium]
KMLELIQSELSQRRAPKMLDLGCGSGRLVCELAPEIHTSGARCSCLDLDPAALNFVSDRLGYVGLSDTAELLTFNALRIIDSDTALKEFGMQDIICTLGYFDQLPDDFFVKLVRTLYRMLNPGGRSIFAVRNASFVRSNLYQWLVDWNAIHKRTRSDFDRLLQEANIPDSTVSVVQSDSGALLFYTITK